MGVSLRTSLKGNFNVLLNCTNRADNNEIKQWSGQL